MKVITGELLKEMILCGANTLHNNHLEILWLFFQKAFQRPYGLVALYGCHTLLFSVVYHYEILSIHLMLHIHSLHPIYPMAWKNIFLVPVSLPQLPPSVADGFSSCHNSCHKKTSFEWSSSHSRRFLSETIPNCFQYLIYTVIST